MLYSTGNMSLLHQTNEFKRDILEFLFFLCCCLEGEIAGESPQLDPFLYEGNANRAAFLSAMQKQGRMHYLKKK